MMVDTQNKYEIGKHIQAWHDFGLDIDSTSFETSPADLFRESNLANRFAPSPTYAEANRLGMRLVHVGTDRLLQNYFVLPFATVPQSSSRTESEDWDSEARELIKTLKDLTTFSKSRLARDLLGVSRRSLYNWEDNEISPDSLTRLRTLAEIFGIAQKSIARARKRITFSAWLSMEAADDGDSMLDVANDAFRSGEFFNLRSLALQAGYTSKTSALKNLRTKQLSPQSLRLQRLRDTLDSGQTGTSE